jgi:hypothetical protein
MKAERSDIETETAATVVPAAALSCRDTELGAKVVPVGVGAGGVGVGGGDEPQEGGVVLGVLNTDAEPFHTYQRPLVVSAYIWPPFHTYN